MSAVSTAPPAASAPAAVVPRSRLAWLLGLTALLVLVIFASIAIGSRALSFAEVWHGLFTPTGLTSDGIIRSLRLPRTVLGLASGIALGIAGALIQGHTRNPLADTGLLGLNAGAAFAAVLAIQFLALTDPGQYVWFALAGSLAAGLIVFAISMLGKGFNPLTLALAGAAVTLILQALTNAVVLLDAVTLDAYRFWVVGSVAGRDGSVFWQVAPFLLAGTVIALASAPGLNTISLGENVARALGTHVGWNRAAGLAAVVLLSGAATAACGPIAFLGLVAPHLARAITGPDYRWLVPCAGLVGAILLLSADILGRVVAPPGELQVGIVLALAGAPFFIAIVRRRKLAAL